MKPSLDYFIVIAEELNISAAAKKLNISQQSLSAYLKNLEQYYNATLLERRPVMQLTEAGRMLYTMGKRLETMRSELDFSISRRTEKNVNIRIGVSSFNGSRVLQLIPLVPFVTRFKNASLEVVEASGDSLLEMLKNGTVNLAIRSYTKQPLPAGFASSVIEKEKLYLMMPRYILKSWKAYSWKDAEEKFTNGISIEDMAGCPLIEPEPNSSMYHQLMSYCNANNVELNTVCTAYNSYSALDMCYAGLGACFAPESQVDFMRNNEKFWNGLSLVAFPVTGVLSTINTVLVYRNDGDVSREYQQLVDLTLQRAADKERGLYKSVLE